MPQDIKVAPMPSAEPAPEQVGQIPVKMPDQAVEPQVASTNPMVSQAQLNTESDQHLDKILQDTSQAVKKAEPKPLNDKTTQQTSKDTKPKKPIMVVFTAVVVMAVLLAAAFSSFRA